jgi:flagellar L-ring protein precursor FlgH
MTMSKLMRLLPLAGLILLSGCVNKPPKPDNPYYAPVQPAQMEPPKPVNGAIYQANAGLDLYSDGRAYRVGDILTVVLTESTQSSKSASTTVDKTNDMSFGAPTVLGRELSVLGNPLSASASTDTAFDSQGDSDMSNSLSGNITVTVHQVLPNGNLLVRGEKWLTLNQGDEYIRISGLVRKQDIGPDNSVESTRLADARIAYSGNGATHDANVMGWLARFFISPLWPF